MAFADRGAPPILVVRTSGRHEIDVVGIPLEVLGVTPATNGSASIVDGQLIVDIPDGGTETFTLTVGVDQFGARVTETVIVSPIHLVASPELAESAASIAPEGSSLADGDVSDSSTEDAGRRAMTRVDTLTPNLATPPALLALQDLKLPVFELSAGALLSLLAALVARRHLSRSTYLAVDRTDRASMAAARLDGGQFNLRHNARGIWTSGRTRNTTIEVETPNGKAWVERENLVRELD